MMKKEEERKKKEEKDRIKQQQKEERRQQYHKDKQEKELKEKEQAGKVQQNPYSVLHKDDEEVCRKRRLWYSQTLLPVTISLKAHCKYYQYLNNGGFQSNHYFITSFSITFMYGF